MLKMVATASLWPAARQHGSEAGRPCLPQDGPSDQLADLQPQDSPLREPRAPEESGVPQDRLHPAGEDMDASEAEVNFDLGAELQEETHNGGEDEMGLAPGGELPDPVSRNADKSEGRCSSLCPRCGAEEETLFHQM